VFGRTGSFVAVAVAMLALAGGLVVLAVGRHLHLVARQIVMGVTSLGFVGVAIMGFVAVIHEPDIGFLLLASYALSVPVVLGIGAPTARNTGRGRRDRRPGSTVRPDAAIHRGSPQPDDRR
jgi:hypothetical protein